MKNKEMYVSVGVLILLVIVGWWGFSRDTTGGLENNQQATTTTPTTQTPTTPVKKPSSTSKVPGSVNPTITPTTPVPSIPTTKSLVGSPFRLTSYNGKPLPLDSKLTLTFTETTFTLKLCNTFSSYYFIDHNNRFAATNVTSTTMYCSSPTDIMKMESDLSMMLNSGQTVIYRSGSTLILSHASGITFAYEGF